MERKVIRISNNTLVCTLPSQFVKEWNISQGDILHTDIEEQSVIFSCTKKNSTREITTESCTPDDLELWYSLGFDRIRVKKSNVMVAHSLFESIEVHGNEVRLSVCTEVKPEELFPLLRRMYYLCRQYPFHEIIGAVKQYVRICSRILSKHGYKNRMGTLLLMRFLWDIQSKLPDTSVLEAINHIPLLLSTLEQSGHSLLILNP